MSGVMILGATCVVLLAVYLLFGRRLARLWGIQEKANGPGSSHKDQVDFIPSSTPVLMGHHFSSIAGVGFLTGTIQAASFGWLPAFLWILTGGIFFGALLDFSALFVSVRSQGRSIPQVMRKVVGRPCGDGVLLFSWLALVVFSGTMVDVAAEILTGVKENDAGEAVRNSINGSVAMAIMLFIALAVMFGFINRARMNLLFTTVLGVLLMGFSIWLGITFPLYAEKSTWVFFLLIYVFLVSVTPVWALLQPRNYLNSLLFFLLIAAAVVGICLGKPHMQIPAFSNWVNESTDTIFPALFVFLASGTTSGLHGLVASGVTSKQLRKEFQIKQIGYGSMLLVCLMCVVALVVVGSMSELPAVNSAAGGEGVFHLARVFARGLGGFFANIGVYKPAVSVLRIIVLLAIASLVITSLDTSVRVARYLFQELFTGKEGKSHFLNHMYTASLCTVAAVAAVSRWGCQALWPLFSGGNLMLAAFLLIGVACWMKAAGQKSRLYYLPVVVLLFVAWSDLGITFMENVKVIWADGGRLPVVQNICILALLFLSVLVLTEGIKVVFLGQTPTVKEAPDEEEE